MKKFKKIFAVLMTLAMVLGMSMTSMAAGSGKITVTGDNISGATVTYTQIVEEDRESNLGWKFVADVKEEFVKAWATKDPDNNTAEKVIAALIELGKIENVANANVTAGTINGNEAFGAALEAVKNMATRSVDLANGTVAFGGKGLYIVNAVKEGFTYIPMAAYINTALDDVQITAKGSENQITKDVVQEEGKSVEPNQIVEYNATVEYPYFSANTENKTFVVTDKLTNATFKKEANGEYAKVSIQDASGKDVAANVVFSDDGTQMTITFAYNSSLAGKTLTINYFVKANADVSTAKTLKNKITSQVGEKTTDFEVEVKPVSFTVIKTDDNENVDDRIRLEGAEFTIYTEDATDENIIPDVEPISFENKTLYPVRVSETSNGETGFKGQVTFDNLNATKTYYVKETKAPNGYSLNETVYKLEGSRLVSSDVNENVKTYVYSDFTSQTVTDTQLNKLPSTGGIGTTIFTIAGCAIMIVAAALFFASRRKSSK